MADKVKFGETFKLKINEKAVLEGGLKITVDEIMFAQIEADPDGDSPEGHEEVVDITVKRFLFGKKFTLTKMSEGYTSKDQAIYGKYIITLVKADEVRSEKYMGFEGYAELKVELK